MALSSQIMVILCTSPHGFDNTNTLLTGGRQVEGSVPAIWALEKICASPIIKQAQESGKLTVLFDSGIRTGSDIIKAMALGAQGILCAYTSPLFHNVPVY